MAARLDHLAKSNLSTHGDRGFLWEAIFSGPSWFGECRQRKRNKLIVGMSASEVWDLSRMLSSHQLMFKGITRGSAARGDTQLAVNGTQVRVNCVQTQHQLLGDLRISQSRCE